MGLTSDRLTEMFNDLKAPLVRLLQQIKDSKTRPDRSILHGRFSLESQKKICADLVHAIGYSFDSGRIDESTHPFSVGIGPGDARITTRYNESYLGSGMFGCLHEAGHSLYELGLPEKHFGTPAGMYLSVGIHESQSRLWENQVGRSLAFWQFAKSILESHYPVLKSTPLSELVLAMNEVTPGLIRVEAEEVTYNLHVLLRFELELSLFKKDLKPADLPEAWSEKMQSLLSIRPSSIKEGAMQDVHWSAGMFGYFPTYSLGNLYAAQLFAAAKRDIPNLEESFSQGQFSPLLQWLRKHVHSKGQCHTSSELIEQATGELPTSKYLIDYCQAKYSELYDLE
jgi:carboxypeptidase Taq